jgi:hypothetical protein
VGSQTHWDNVENESYDQLFIEGALAVNRFLISEIVNGWCTAYVYAYDTDYGDICEPVIYSDNGNIPLTRRSVNEGDFDIAVGGGKPAGWKSTTFEAHSGNVNYIWFGLFCDWFAPRFDYGAKCYMNYWDYLGDDIPNTYPLFNANYYYDFKLSMYFTYTSAQNHVRTITQGVTLTDKRKLMGNYQRFLVQTAKVNSGLSRFQTFIRTFTMTAYNTMNVDRYPAFFRNVTETIKTSTVNIHTLSIFRKCVETINVNSQLKKVYNAVRKAQDFFSGIDNQNFSVLFFRYVSDGAMVSQKNGHIGSFIRGLAVTAGSTAETRHKGEYYRFQEDTV